MSLPVVLALAVSLIKSEEHCYLHAYPDPLSALGKRLGHAGIVRVGNGSAVPANVKHLHGDPWTIGWGTTGSGIKPGVKWTQQQCDAALIERTELAYQQAQRMYPGLAELRPHAQAAIVSLVYNRGASLRDIPSRLEMRQLTDAIARKDYTRMAALVRSMKRHWPGTGLVARREREALMIEREE